MKQKQQIKLEGSKEKLDHNKEATVDLVEEMSNEEKIDGTKLDNIVCVCTSCWSLMERMGPVVTNSNGYDEYQFSCRNKECGPSNRNSGEGRLTVRVNSETKEADGEISEMGHLKIIDLNKTNESELKNSGETEINQTQIKDPEGYIIP